MSTEIKRDGPSILTAIVFIRAITTVIITVTHPCFSNTSVVIAGKVLSSTGGRETGGTVHFIRAVTTVVHAVAAPIGHDAVFVVAGERIRRAGRSWQLGSGKNI